MIKSLHCFDHHMSGMCRKLSTYLAVFLVTTLLPSSPVGLVCAHTRLECPPPRSGATGAKVGPCDAEDNPSLPPYPLVPNALNTITWLESLGHPGAPARFALSLDGKDEGFEFCILLDHVPHDENSQPTIANPLSYHRASITLFIPDIYCERCHLQLITIMSDEAHGVPFNTTCVYGGAKVAGTASDTHRTCLVVYHSCAPVSINGTVPRNEITTGNTTELENKLDWPFMDLAGQDYSTYYYKGDPGLYNETTAVLSSGGSPIKDCSDLMYCDPNTFFNQIMSVPDEAMYATLAGSCAAMVGMEVENFALGELPDVVLPGRDVILDNIIDNHPADCDSTFCQGVADCFTEMCKDEDIPKCNDPLVTTCDHCRPESPCSSSMTMPGIDFVSMVQTGDDGTDENVDGMSEEGNNGMTAPPVGDPMPGPEPGGEDDATEEIDATEEPSTTEETRLSGANRLSVGFAISAMFLVAHQKFHNALV